MAEFVDYYDVKKPGSFSGTHPSRKWLKTQDTYTLHKPVRRTYPRRKTIVSGMKQQMQSDLIDFTVLKEYNDNYRYIVVLIDVFSKFAYVECIKDKTAHSMIDAFSKLLERSGRFLSLQTDRGTEYVNKSFQKWLKQQNIHFFHSHNYDTKAAIAERFIRTLKERLWRYFTFKNTRRYIDVIHDLVYSYNHTYHRSIKRAPAEVDLKNQEHVWQTLYSDVKIKQPKLKVGDKVRLSMTRVQFRKGYLPGWTNEIFVVAKAIAGSPPYYKIKDLNDEILEGTFYDAELQKIVKKDDTYKIEYIIKKRRRGKHQEYFVKRLGYPDSFSWVRESDFVDYS